MLVRRRLTNRSLFTGSKHNNTLLREENKEKEKEKKRNNRREKRERIRGSEIYIYPLPNTRCPVKKSKYMLFRKTIRENDTYLRFF